MNMGRGQALWAVTGLLIASFMVGCEPPFEVVPVELEGGESFPVPFGAVAGFRELSDGRVLISDPLGQVLARIDFATGAVDTLGPPGSGPDEIGQPDALFPLRGDTSLVVDLGNARLTTLGPDGSVLSTLPMGQQSASGNAILALPSAVDEDGTLYFGSERSPRAGMPNTTALLRFRPEAGILDTLTSLRIPELGPPPLPGGGGMGGKALQLVDEWTVGPHGDVVVVRAEDRTTLRIGSDGRSSSGPEIPAPVVPVREAEKHRWLAAASRAQIIMRSDETGAVQAHRGEDRRIQAEISRFEWPAELPLVLPNGVHLAPSGEVWLERYVPVGEQPFVLRLDPEGRLSGAVTLPPGRRVAGFGADAVFLIHSDEFDLQRLERYPIPTPGMEACTGFVLHPPGGLTVGKNLDWTVGEGILVVNEKGVEKDAWRPSGEPTFSWVSRFGSVTFNQFGWGSPLGGMNEAGLVVEEMSYSPSRYPEPDDRPGLTEFQWIQYQLDRHATVEEVLASAADIRIERFLFGLHFLVADRTGKVAVIEFLNGDRTVYFGEDLPVPVLANDTYANSVRYLRHHKGFGGERIPTDGPESPERFVRAAMMVRAMSAEGPGQAESGESPDPVAGTFAILESVRQNDTQWTIAYDLLAGAVSFKTAALPDVRTLRLNELDFRCHEEDRVLPLTEGLPTVSADGKATWGPEENRAVVDLVFQKLERVFGAGDLPDGSVRASLADYPSSARCRGVEG